VSWLLPDVSWFARPAPACMTAPWQGSLPTQEQDSALCRIETGGNRRHAAANVWLHALCHQDNTATSLAYPILGVCCAIDLILCLPGQPKACVIDTVLRGTGSSCSEVLTCLSHFCTAHVAPR
jgi:hypothetical protein